MNSLIDPDTIKDLLRDSNITLDKAMDICRAMKAAKIELHSWAGMMSSAVVIPTKTSDFDLLSSESVYVAKLLHNFMLANCDF